MNFTLLEILAMSQPYNLSGKSEAELLDIFRAIQEALKTEKRYHATLDNMMEGFQIIDRDWRYFYVNDTVVQQSKYSREDLIGFTMMEKYPGIENTELFTLLRICMYEKKSQQMENQFTFPDGSTGWFKLSIQPIPEGIFILSMDISDQKRRELEKEQRIKEMSELMFKISHEVRSPLVNILGASEVLENQNISQKDTQEMVDILKNSATKLDSYTRDLVEFVRSLH